MKNAFGTSSNIDKGFDVLDGKTQSELSVNVAVGIWKHVLDKIDRELYNINNYNSNDDERHCYPSFDKLALANKNNRWKMICREIITGIKTYDNANEGGKKRKTRRRRKTNRKRKNKNKRTTRRKIKKTRRR